MGVGTRARLLPSELFYRIFMILRVAWQCWFNAPREPFAVEEHCALARNIDRFFEVDMLNWGDFAMCASALSPKLLTRDEVEETLARVRIGVDREGLEAAFARLYL
ncbi:hypothetical protein QBC36DRAFT_295634 [Triangularia setosa]|uniref:Uncharacterized protein n=1 Tax=Triangularia setosa TaxID=2587417 RepID=A0AAN6VZ18_9PEZI|nr:hypothetical protein QBC36DRAFT_295634 [Podospora setosa]